MNLPTEEVRLAMGWNGGVSLAVWMGGVAVELDCARRAHLSPEDDLDPPRGVYAALCRAFDRKVVLDIFAGASAGGLNSALLGAAIVAGRRLHPDFLRAKWIEIGDFSKLLQPTNVSEPTSVMQGSLFADSVLKAFQELMAPPVTVKGSKPKQDLCALPASQAQASRSLPLLDIQATNVMGKQRGFLDAWGRQLFAREYRSPLRFRKPEDFTPATLAAAARASASFPAAFEPYPLVGEALRLSGLRDDPEARWNREVASRSRPEVRYAIDGGLLENAPIRQAIELIPSRPAAGPVARFVVYVNANPSSFSLDTPNPRAPNLQEVIGYVVNLPRTGRDVDQIDAITEAKRRSEKNSDTLDALLAVPHDDLVATAAGLFSAYRKRRAYSAWDDILGDGGPVRVEVVDELMRATHDGALLPWFPASFAAPTAGLQWNWGFRAAQRILYLQLDLLGKALHASFQSPDRAGAVAETIYTGRRPIDAAIAQIETGYQEFLSYQGLAPSVAELRAAVDDPADAADTLNVLTAIYDGYRIDQIWQPLRAASESFYATARTLAAANLLPLFDELFAITAGASPPESLSEEGFRRLLERALAIEVVRRAFVDDSDIDAAQDFSFAQLAPNAGVRIFTDTPVRESGPNDSTTKLTGIKLGHFAGFYRSSWRANDFMWGRLDAATRIVDILVDRQWQPRLPPDATPWDELADSLIPATDSTPANRDLRLLATEALKDGAQDAPNLDTETSRYLRENAAPSADASDAAALRDYVADALKHDLTATDERQRGFLTRVMLSRAAQYETLRAELAVLQERVIADREDGATTEPFAWNLDGSLLAVITELRNFQGEEALPKRLGRDSDDELTSTLALRTVSHAALVSLAALPGLAMPLGRLTLPLRLPFLSVAGTASKSLLANLAAVISFGAATWYLATRVITADNNRLAEARNAQAVAPQGQHVHYAHPVYLGELKSPAVLAMLIAALVVAGVLIVPAARAFRSSHKLWHLAWCVLLLAAAGAIPLYFGARHAGLAVTLTGSGGFTPSHTVLWATFAVAGIGTLGARHLPLGKLVKTLEARTRGVSVLAIGASGLLLAWSSRHLWHARNDGNWHSWHRIAALAAAASMPLLIVYAFRVSWLHTALITPGRVARSKPARWAARVWNRLTGHSPLSQPDS